MKRRLLPLLLQLVICIQAGFVAAVIPAAPIVPTAAASGACTISAGATGGIVSACAAADTYEDLVSDLQLSFASLHDEVATSPLSVTSQPTGASVQINGLTVGVTPLNTTLPPGTYLVRVSKSGFDSYNTSVQVGNSAAAVNAALNPVDDRPVAVYEWLHPATLIGLAGAPADCDLEASNFVRDKAGDYYVSFSCVTQGNVPVDAPEEAPGYVSVPTIFRPQLRTSGVVRTTDKGRSWTLVKSWTDTFAARAWTSPRFADTAPGTPAADGTVLDSHFDHWLRAYYQEKTSELWSIWGLIPREDGGVSILVAHSTSHTAQETAAYYDNAGITTNPHKFMPANTVQIQPSGPWRLLAHPDMQARFGLLPEDLGTSYAEVLNENRVVGSDGGDSLGTITGPPLALGRPSYQGSYQASDYFLGFGAQPSGGTPDYHGYIFRSTDGGQTISMYQSYDIGLTSAARSEELRIGPDGSLYVIDHANGGVWAIEDAGPRLLGRAPSSLNFGVSGGNNTPYLSVDFDSAGNLYGAFRSSITSSDNSQMRIFYQYFPLHTIAYTGVALLTEPACALCDTTSAWLDSAGVNYQLNPSDLPTDIAATAAAEAAQHGYPVLVRLGANAVARGGVDSVTAARLLAISYPVLIETHVPTVSNVAPASGPFGVTIEAQWLQMIVENDRPHVILERRDGVGDLTPGAGGDWEFTKIMDSPPHVQDSPTLIFSKRYPALPGGNSTFGRPVIRQTRYNDIATVNDFVMLYNSEAFSNPSGGSQRGYTLWHLDGGGATESAYRVIQDVSQLIPAAAFYVALGDHGTPGPVTGELADYVTSQQIVTDGVARFYKVVVDLRAKNETATNGNIFSRGIGGSVHVDTQTVDGDPDARDISLIMVVGNTRLRTFDPQTRDASRDITAEAVHFTGDNEHWVVTNNIGLPNDIPCGPDQSLLLDPFSTATFTAATVSGFDIGSCLAALEVTPTVIAQCDTWDDVKLVLAGDTIAALTGSLPITRSEDITNWELSYGSRSAQITRIVSFDRPIDALSGSGSCPASAGEIADATAAVVGVDGQFIGSGAYQPTITVLDRGTAAILTTPKAKPGSLAWEREWLEFESAILEGNLNISIRDEAAANVLFLDRLKKRIAYSRQLLATRALLHCNYEGVGLDAVRQLIARSAGTPEALTDTRVCLQGFVLNPKLHWPSYSSTSWLGGSYQADFVGSVISNGLEVNPTLAYLAASSDGDVIDYGDFLIPRAHILAGNGSEFSTDMELDHYARMATFASRELVGFDGRFLRAIMLSGQVERTAMNSLVSCARTMTGDAPLARMIELTSQRAYQPGIPCVDARAGASRDQWFQLVGIALRSGTWGAIYDAAGRDLDLAFKLLDGYATALTKVAALEAQYPAGTTAARWSPDLPAADRLMIATRQIRVTQEARGHQITVSELPQVLAGMTECGIGFVKGFWPDGLIMIAAGGVAMWAGPLAGAVGGLLFLGFGTVVTGLGVADLAQVWESLDLAAKTSGICGAAIGVVLTLAGIDGTINAAMSLTPADLRFSPPKMIEPNTVSPTGRAAGLTLEEQGEALSPRGGDIEQPAIVSTAPIDAAIQAGIDRLPEAQRPAAEYAVRKLNATAMSDVEKAVVAELISVRDTANNSKAQHRILNMLLHGDDINSPEYKAWDVVGEALIQELSKPAPKSVAVDTAPAAPATATTPAKPARIVGTDAEIETAADTVGKAPPDSEITPGQDKNAIVARQPKLLEAVLGSSRLLKLLQGGVQRLFSFEEVNYFYQRAHKSLATATFSFFSELARSRVPTALRNAAAEALRVAGEPGARIVSLETELLPYGSKKVAVRLTMTLEDGRTVDFTVAKGDIGQPEADIYAKYGPLNITQKLLTPLTENVDGAQALLVTEYVPGLRVPPGIPGWLQLSAATADAGYAGAIGKLDTRIWLRTRNPEGTADFSVAGEADINTDLHLSNMNVFERNGVKDARAVDFDPFFTRKAAEDLYWVTSLLRRNSFDDISLAVRNYDAYLGSVLDEFVANGSTRDAGLALLRRVRTDLNDPAIVARAEALQGPSIQDPTLVPDTIRALDAFLAAQSSRVLQFPSVATLFRLARAA